MTLSPTSLRQLIDRCTSMWKLMCRLCFLNMLSRLFLVTISITFIWVNYLDMINSNSYMSQRWICIISWQVACDFFLPYELWLDNYSVLFSQCYHWFYGELTESYYTANCFSGLGDNASEQGQFLLIHLLKETMLMALSFITKVSWKGYVNFVSRKCLLYR